jgi:toxin YoeB
MPGRREPPRQHARERTLVVTRPFVVDLQHWVAADARMALRVLKVVLEVARDPREGIGKPERLKHRKGDCSRRLSREHRLVYRYDEEHVEFVAAQFHYE